LATIPRQIYPLDQGFLRNHLPVYSRARKELAD
jgi:hypothetical protein